MQKLKQPGHFFGFGPGLGFNKPGAFAISYSKSLI
jgi:hypothetical protein